MSAPAEQEQEQVRVCRECGCTDADCSGCIERTGAPCWWVELDLCSAHPDPCPVGDPECVGEVPGEWRCHDGCEPAPGPPPYEPPRVAPDRECPDVGIRPDHGHAGVGMDLGREGAAQAGTTADCSSPSPAVPGP